MNFRTSRPGPAAAIFPPGPPGISNRDPSAPDLSASGPTAGRRRLSGPSLRAVFWAYGAVTLLLLLSPFSRSLLVLFPAFSFLVALFAFHRSRTAYVSLVCWLFMLSPLVRRLVDYRAGWIPATAVLLAPLLATGVTAIPLLSEWKALSSRLLAPFVLIFAAIFYGSVVALLQHNPLFSFALAFLYWVFPLCFAVYLIRNRQAYRELYHSIETTFVRGLLLISVYGLYQFFAILPWDALWMENVGLNSIGSPAPMQVRIFGTLNSPQTLASFLVVGIIFAFQSPSRLRFVAIPAGLLALALTISRTAWLGLGAAVVYLFFVSDKRQRLILGAVAGICIGLFSVAFQVPEIATMVQSRAASLTDTSDASLNARTSGYSVIFETALDAPYGQGVGFAEGTADSPTQRGGGAGLGQGDSSVVAILFSFGLPGTLLYSIALLIVIQSAFSRQLRANESMLAPTAILLALLCEAPFTSILAGPGSFLVWMSAAFCLILAHTSATQTLPAHTYGGKATSPGI